MAGTPEISQGSESVYQKKKFNIQHFEGNKMQSSYILEIFLRGHSVQGILIIQIQIHKLKGVSNMVKIKLFSFPQNV